MAEELIPSSIKDKITKAYAAAQAQKAAGITTDTAGFRLGVARKRFKEGLTNEEQFTTELRLLGIPEGEIPLEIIAGRMDYAFDYTMDLIAAWRDGVRKGNISIDKYKEHLTSLGMVPERVVGYILRETVRQSSEGDTTLVAPVTPFYQTDSGKIQVDTLRRQRRKLLITRDQEIAALVDIGMSTGEAQSIADNDDVRIAEKGGAE